MRKAIKFSNLDCAHCALKIEDEIKKLEGVEKATVSLITEKITVTAADDKMESILCAIPSICKKVEPDMELI